MNLSEQFNRDGYVVVRDLVRDLDTVKDEILSLTGFFSFGLEQGFKNLFDYKIDNYKSFLSLSTKLRVVQDLFSRRRVLDIAEDLGIKNVSYPSQPVLHVMSPDLKIPKGYYGTEAHQDWPSVQGSLDMITVWIALTDIDHFPIEVIPGSHLKGLRKGKSNDSVLKVAAKDKDFIPLKCKAGDAIFLSGFVVHRTGKGDGFRMAVSQRFDNVDEPTFYKRGYPCVQKRVVDRTIKWEPTVKQVRDIYA